MTALRQRLTEKKSRLIIRKGSALKELRKLLKETGATRVMWNRCYEPTRVQRDKEIKSTLLDSGFSVESFNGALLREPWEVMTAGGTPYQVFTPFWSAHRSQPPPPPPLVEPKNLKAPDSWPTSVALEELALEPKLPWDRGLRKTWMPGESGARSTLKRFLETSLDDYPTKRDIPSDAGTTRLSPHLHFGEISPRQIWKTLEEQRRSSASPRGIDTLEKELGWREFAYHLLFHFPHTTNHPLRKNFAAFPWNRSPKELKAWQRGQTGYPIVDAGMRELWNTGWMHNRVRMIVASFLVKDLRISWVEGARWFWDTLVDADLANNTLGWQWSAGCGADAAPYFRIFNPVLQGKKFDPNGDYVRRWVPELKTFSSEWIHEPWKVPEGKTYIAPIVDHGKARALALRAFRSLKPAS